MTTQRLGSKLIPIGLGTFLQISCMSLDGMVSPAYPLEKYDLSTSKVPKKLREEVSFKSIDGTKLYGVWLHQDPPKPPLLWLHGNGGPLDHLVDRLDYYWSWGEYDIFAVDYRGYGKSEGEPTRDGIYEQDGLAAVKYVSKTTGVDPASIPWIALSLGGGVAAHTASKIDARAIVYESMFPSTDMLLDDGSGLDLPTGWFFREEWDNVRAIAKSRSPSLIIHGQQDDYIDWRYSNAVFDAAPEPKQLWQPAGVGHTDSIHVEPEQYRRRVLGFFKNPTAAVAPSWPGSATSRTLTSTPISYDVADH